MAWSGTYIHKEDTFFCIPYLSIVDTSINKYNNLKNNSIQQFIFVEKENMLKDITRSKANLNSNKEWFDSLYVTNRYYDNK